MCFPGTRKKDTIDWLLSSRPSETGLITDQFGDFGMYRILLGQQPSPQAGRERRGPWSKNNRGVGGKFLYMVSSALGTCCCRPQGALSEALQICWEQGCLLRGRAARECQCRVRIYASNTYVPDTASGTF